MIGAPPLGAGLSADLTRHFATGGGVDARFTAPSGGAVTVLFGPSGSGKSTILRCLAGLERPNHGRIALGARVLFDREARVDVPTRARKVGFVFQEPALFPHMTVAANLAFGLPPSSRGAKDEAVAALAARFGLEALLGRSPSHLAGGEKQRVALARSLAPAPELLLLDEPLSGLDAAARSELRGELRRWLAGSGAAVVLVTHDRAEALALGDYVVVLDGGAVRQSGPALAVFARPADANVARVTGVDAVVAGTVVPHRTADDAAHLCNIAVGSARLQSSDEAPLGAEVYALIRAEDVILATGDVGPASARNRLACTVVGVTFEGPTVRIALDAGFPLVALVTRPAATELSLAVGDRVTALIKAGAIQLVTR